MAVSSKLGIYERVPDLNDRIAITIACSRSDIHRKRAKEAAAASFPWFCNTFAFTIDPRKETHAQPFILYPFQIDFANWLQERVDNKEDGLILKSRDMGCTWTYLAFITWKWLFHPGFHTHIGSRKEENVDNFTEKSLFGKIEEILRRLPGWLLPKGFSLKKNRRERRLMNPENGNEITGEATNRDFSRSGRFSMVIFDEAAFWPDLHLSWGAASSSTPTRIAVSTVNRENPQNFFYELRQNVVQNVMELHWSLHPDFDEAWYEVQKARLTQEEVDHELDMLFIVSRVGMVYPNWADVPKGHYPYQPGWELYTSWDFGLRDTSIIWWQRDTVTGEIRMIDSYQAHDYPITYYIPFITGSIPSDSDYIYGIEEQRKIAEHGTWGQSINYGDPAGNQSRDTDGNSVIGILADNGIYVHTNSKANSHKDRRDATLRLLSDVRCNITQCAKVDSSMSNSRYPERNPNSSRVTEVVKPIMDWTSHFRTSVEFFAVNLPPNRAFYNNLPDPVPSQRAYHSIGKRKQTITLTNRR